MLPGCNYPAVVDLQSALEHPDVVQAFASGPVFYGCDSRPVDGSVLVVTDQGREITVGSQCDAHAIPEGVAALVTALLDLDRKMKTSVECRELGWNDCETNAQCAAGFYCRHAAAQCSGLGTCQPRPTLCPATTNPGCSCDGIYYGNECDANADGREFTGGQDCLSTGTCGDWRISASGDCGTSFGWTYQTPDGVSIACAEVVGCTCTDFAKPCTSQTVLYGSKAACERAHEICNQGQDH